MIIQDKFGVTYHQVNIIQSFISGLQTIYLGSLTG